MPAIPAAPAAVAAFLAAEADRGFRPVTIGRRAAAIAAAHRAQDHPNPCDSGAVAQVLSGIRRRHGIAPERRAAPLDLSPLEQVLAQLDLWKNRDVYKPAVYILPKKLDEEVARLHLEKIGVKLTKLTPAQAAYIGVPIEGPYKPEHYRY